MIDMWEVVNSSLVERVVDSGVVTAIIPAPGREQELVETLKNQSHVTVYRKDEIPDRFHYKNHPRIMPVIVLADEGWQFSAVSSARATFQPICSQSTIPELLSLTHFCNIICHLNHHITTLSVETIWFRLTNTICFSLNKQSYIR